MSENFFEFSGRYLSSVITALPLNLKFKEHLDLIKGRYSQTKFPVIFKEDEGKRIADILDTGHVNLFLISERIKVFLEEAKATGWSTYPICLYDKKNNQIPGYYGFSILGTCDRIDYKKSVIIERRRVPEGPICKFYKGIYIDNWDGSDFFSPEGTYQIFATKKIVDGFKKNKMTNMYFKSLVDFEIDIDFVK